MVCPVIKRKRQIRKDKSEEKARIKQKHTQYNEPQDANNTKQHKTRCKRQQQDKTREAKT